MAGAFSTQLQGTSLKDKVDRVASNVPKGLVLADLRYIESECPHCGTFGTNQKISSSEGDTVRILKGNGTRFVDCEARQTHLVLKCLTCGKHTYVLYQAAHWNNSLTELADEQIVHHFPPRKKLRRK